MHNSAYITAAALVAAGYQWSVDHPATACLVYAEALQLGARALTTGANKS